jgi:hypothetical protein
MIHDGKDPNEIQRFPPDPKMLNADAAHRGKQDTSNQHNWKKHDIQHRRYPHDEAT